MIKIEKQFQKKKGKKNKYLPKFKVLMSKQAFSPSPVMLFVVVVVSLGFCFGFFFTAPGRAMSPACRW